MSQSEVIFMENRTIVGIRIQAARPASAVLDAMFIPRVGPRVCCVQYVGPGGDVPANSD